MKVTILILFFLFSSIPKSRGIIETTRMLTVSEALSYALIHSPLLNKVSSEKEIFLLQENSSFAQFLPKLDFSANQTQQGQNPNQLETPFDSQLNFNLTQNLYDNSYSWTQYLMAKEKRKQGELIYKKERNHIIRDILSEYMKFSLSVKLSEIQQNQVILIKKQFDLVTDDYHRGVKTEKEYLRFKTRASRVDIDLLNAQNLVEKYKENLRSLIGFPWNSTEKVDFLPDETKPNLKLLPKSPPDLQTHLDYLIAEKQKVLSDYEVNLAERRYYPELFSTASINYIRPNYLGVTSGSTKYSESQNTSIWSWNITLNFKFNLWDGGIRNNDIKISLLRNKTVELDNQTKFLSLQSDLKRLMLDLKSMSENYKLSRELFQLEQNNLKILQKDYQEGRVEYLNLITGMNDFADAQIKYFTSLYDLRLAFYSYLFHQGTLYDFINEQQTNAN